LAFTDGGAFSTGVFGRTGNRSSMSLANIGYASNGLFWDGRSGSLEDQALHPIEDELEMAEKWPNVEKKLKQSAFYQEHFRKAFGIKSNQEINKHLAAKALAQFQRTLISYNSKFDRFLRRETFLSDDEMDGYLMFIDESMSILKDAECGHCHIVNLMSGEQYFHNGLVSEDEMDANPGRFKLTQNPADKGKFRSPTLRNIMVTAPYMHDGRLSTIEDVMEHYRSGGHKTFNRDLLIEDLASVQLSDTDIQKLIKFMGTLTDSTFLTNPDFSNPFDQ
jgi:cytochrome c peroxidase